MSDPTVTVAAETPSITVDPSKPVAPLAPAVAAPEPPAAGSQDPTPDPSKDPAWVKDRLEQMKRSILKETGFESVEEAKEAAEAARAAKEAKKSQTQKLTEAESALKKAADEKKELADALSVHAKAQMAALSEEQRTTITALAGDDPAKQLKAIEALRPMLAKGPDKPADTMPAPNAPKAGAVVAQSDHTAFYEEWKTKNPIFAARWALENGYFENKK